jgi:hypothetical protein
MRNNILGGLVIFLVVVTCLIVLDDISSPKSQDETATEFNQKDTQSTGLAVIETAD